MYKRQGMSLPDYQRALNQITIGVLAVVAVGFQGGMMGYYLSLIHI